MEHHRQIYFFLAFFIGIILLSIFVFQPFLSVLAVAATIAVVSNRLNERMQKILRGDGLAAFFTTCIVLVLVLIPLIFFAVLVFNEAANLYISASANKGKDIADFILLMERKLRVILPATTLNANAYLLAGLEWVVANMSAIFARVTESLLMFFLGFFSLYYFLKDGKRLLATIALMSPLPDTYDRQIFDRLERAVIAVITGSLVVSLLQGILVGVGLLIFGVPNPALWGGIAALAALIPGPGTALVTVPAVIYLYFTSSTAGAIGLTLWGAILVGLVDNFLKPILMGRQANISPFIIFLSVLGGISFFGVTGVILGPLVVSLLFAFLEIYLDLMREKKI